MHFILGVVALLAAGLIWYNRIRNAAEVGAEVVDKANDARLAIRRFSYQRKAGKHPIFTIDDARVAGGSLAVAFMEVGDTPTTEQKFRLQTEISKRLHVSVEEAKEILALGHWFTGQCNDAHTAAVKLAKQLSKLAGPDVSHDLQAMLYVGLSDGETMTAAQRATFNDLSKIFDFSVLEPQ
ncbi:hypothetical protein ACMG4P_16865 [Pseudovibrio denitrificans]|uniref:hypothetical protein n=1 Tax=Pseudovibrio denitrificans TaxID=258256 RepID=UPI0039BF42BD